MAYQKIIVTCLRLISFTTLSIFILYKDIYPYGLHMKKLFDLHTNITSTINGIESTTKDFDTAFQLSNQLATQYFYVTVFQMRGTLPSKNKEDFDIEALTGIYESVLYYRGRDLSLQQNVFRNSPYFVHFTSNELFKPYIDHLVEVDQRRIQRLKKLTKAMILYHASLVNKEDTKSFMKDFKEEMMDDEGVYFDLQGRCLAALSFSLNFQVSILQGCLHNAEILTGLLIVYQLVAIVILLMKPKNVVSYVYILSIVFLFCMKESLIMDIQYRLNDPDNWNEEQVNEGEEFLAHQFKDIHLPYQTWLLIIVSMSLSHFQFEIEWILQGLCIKYLSIYDYLKSWILLKFQSFIRKFWPEKEEEIKCANDNQVLDQLERHQRINIIKNEVRKIFECCVCLEYMKQPGPRYIYGCTNDHYICSKCLKSPTIKSCPQCRECFRKHSPKRRYQTEAMQELFQKLFDEIHKN